MPTVNKPLILVTSYYVMIGQGAVMMSTEGNGSEVAPIQAGDAIWIRVNEVHSFQNTGSEPLELPSNHHRPR